jgi:hypothetical protein
LAVGVGKEDSLGRSDCEFCKLEEVRKSLGVGIKDGEGVL